jgi:hypothetical protein
VFYEPNGAYRGRDEIDRIAGVIKATHPDFQYQPLSPPEEIGDGCQVRWVSGSPGKPPAYAGTDFIVVRDGKIAAVYLFFLPKAAALFRMELTCLIIGGKGQLMSIAS